MKEITTDELKSLQLEMLAKIDEFCIKNNIKYSIDYGTLIGAIRHKGYIPWDDDIDISIPRPDYEKFIATFNGFDKNLKVIAPEHDWDFFEPYANVYDNRTILFEAINHHHGFEIGVKIDVFPLDGTPSNIREYEKITKVIDELNKVRYIKKVNVEGLRYLVKHPRRVLLQLMHPFYLFISYSKVQKRIKKIATSTEYDRADYVDNVVFHPYKNARTRRENVTDFIRVPFEDKTFNAFAGYDQRLKDIYGDYMTLPPVDKRVYKHGFTAFWKD